MAFMGITPRNTPLASSPYRVGGATPIAGNFKQAPSGFQWGAQFGRPMSPNFSGMGRYDALSALGNMAGGALGLDRDPNDQQNEEPKEKGNWIKRLLTGESGAAVGGIAQGAGTVIGSYLNRKTQSEANKLERQKFEEELRREQQREDQRKAIRNLLMPVLGQYSSQYTGR